MPKLSDIQFKSVAFGFLVDTCGTMALASLLVLALSSADIPRSEITIRLKSTSGLLLNLIMGLGCTFLGGYVAGRTAEKAEVLHGGLVAGAGIILAMAFWDLGMPRWYDITGLAAMLPAGMSGGFFAGRRRTRGNIDRG